MDIMIQNYKDFLAGLTKVGFTMAGGNSEGIFALIPWGWQEAPPYPTTVSWHTGDPDKDPWQWRIRVLEENPIIAYGKVFFKKGGFITKQWYPYFLAARRSGKTFRTLYSAGILSYEAKQLYAIIESQGPIALHRLKIEAGIEKADQSQFERTLVELQMGLFITIHGTEQKVSLEGMPYGWSSTVFSTTEQFFGPQVFEEAGEISKDAAFEKIRSQILLLNPDARDGKIQKFILG